MEIMCNFVDDLFDRLGESWLLLFRFSRGSALGGQADEVRGLNSRRSRQARYLQQEVYHLFARGADW